jgi:hypothetical protein
MSTESVEVGDHVSATDLIGAMDAHRRELLGLGLLQIATGVNR